MSTSKKAPRKSSAATAESVIEPPKRDKERFIVLLRHGIAEDRSEEKRDEDRSLTPEGHARMKQIARGLERALPKAQAIYASPLLRSVQTALWVSKAYRSRLNVNTVDALAPAGDVAAVVDFVNGLTDKTAILVGHEPNLTNVARALLRLDDRHALELKKGGCYGVRISAAGDAALEWMLTPRILRKMAASMV